MKIKNGFKKMMSVLLAAVMTLSMGISVFAAPNNDTVDVTIKYQGSTMYTETISISGIQSEVGANNHFYKTTPYADYASDGVKTPTVADALIKAYALKNSVDAKTIAVYDTSYPGTPTAVSYNWDLNPVYGNP